MARAPRMDPFTLAYIEAALWSSNDESDDSGGKPLDENYNVEDIAPETRDRMIADCVGFQERFAEQIGSKTEQAGHDFWLTRNGHGAGFWDGDWPEPAATELTDGSKEYGETYLYVGDDGKIHGHEETRKRGGRVRASRQTTGQWTVEPGRYLVFAGRPFVHLDKEGTDTRPVEADGAAQVIADLFNREGVTPSTIYERHMGRPRKTRR